MTNLNKTYHKGKFRSHEWAKHLRPYLKRQGNKRFRKVALTLDQIDESTLSKSSKKNAQKTIRARNI